MSRPVVTLYVTGDCHLCVEAEGLLRRLGPEMDFRLEVMDISGDAALHELASGDLHTNWYSAVPATR